MTRYDIARKAYENKEIEADTFGQLHLGNFTNETILKAVERRWISTEFAARLLDAEIESEAEAVEETSTNRKMIEVQILTCNGKIAYYKDVIQSNIEDIQEAAARLTPDNCSEAGSIQTYAQRIADAKARISELTEFITSLKLTLQGV